MNYPAPTQKKLRGRPPSPHSDRAMAKQAGISERQLYYAKELRRSGREDLKAAVEDGRRRHPGAARHRAAGPLYLAWSRCSDDEQIRFLLFLAMPA